VREPKFKILQNLPGDKKIWYLAILLAIISILAVFSSVSSLAVKNHGGNPMVQFSKHIFMLVLGFGVMVFTSKVKVKFIEVFARLAFIPCVGLLLFTLLYGVNINSASRWISIPFIGINFQSSDLAKVVLVIFVARFLALKKDHIENKNEVLFPIGWRILLIVGLILPANFSTAAMLFVVAVSILFFAKVPVKQLGISLVLMVAVGYGTLKLGSLNDSLPRLKTWVSRIENFSDGGADSQKSYQSDHAKIAIASGGIVPKGPGNGVSRNFLPHPYSDMIYAFIIEEYGAIIGGLFIILCYLGILHRCMVIAGNTSEPFVAYTALGLGILICMQAFINMGVSVGLFPVTGQPLPLVSLGGTSTIITCFVFGVLISLSKHQLKEKEAQVAKAK
jgi:cell division protein FtsW